MEDVLTRRFRNYLRERDEGAQTGQAVRVPAEPAADRRRQGPAQRRGARARGARPRRHLRGEPRQAVRRGVPAGRLRAGAHPARLGGAVPAAAGARRGAPLRDHVPPPAARQEDDDVGARRRARPRPDPQEAAPEGVRLGEEDARARRGGAPRALVAARRRSARPSMRGCTASSARRWRRHESRCRSTSRSSPACPARPFRSRATCSRTSASSSSTTCRRCSSARSPSSRAAPRSPMRYALVVDVRSRATSSHDLARRDRRAAPQRRAHARAVPRRGRRRARPPLRGEPAPPSAVRHRPRQSTASRASARCSSTLKGDADVIVDTSNLNVHELRDRLARAVRRPRRRRRAAGERRVVRLQARPAARRRHGVRLPLPAEPALGRRAAAAAPASTPQCATT